MNPSSSTIAALLTPLAPGAIAVIGVAGPETDTLLDRLLSKSSREGAPPLPDRRPGLCRIVEDGVTLDDAVMVRIKRDHGITAEICTHGGVRIAQRALLLLEKLGARIVDPWAYCESVLKIDPIERDVDRALMASASRRLTHWLLSQRAILPNYLRTINALDDHARAAFLDRSRAAIRLISGLHIALVGPPNVGKSTLANRLCGRDRVITSDQPGTTRDWVSETVLIDGWPVTLTDTAGLRQTNCRIEAEAIRRSRQQTHRADAILVVLDATVAAGERRRQWEEILATLPEDRPRWLVQNKIDRPDGTVIAFDEVETCGLSALTGEGVKTLEMGLAALFGLDLLEDHLPTVFLPRKLPYGAV